MKHNINSVGLLLTIGYASFNDNFSITNSVGYVRSDVLVRITGVSTNSDMYLI